MYMNKENTTQNATRACAVRYFQWALLDRPESRRQVSSQLRHMLTPICDIEKSPAGCNNLKRQQSS